MEQVRRILINGMKGYVGKCRRRTFEGSRLHRTSEESSFRKNKRKLLGKSTWYRGIKNTVVVVVTSNVPGSGGYMQKRTDLGNANKNDMRTRAVIFVEQTLKGELAKQVREQIQKLEYIMGYRIHVVERTGRNILSAFPQTATWNSHRSKLTRRSLTRSYTKWT